MRRLRRRRSWKHMARIALATIAATLVAVFVILYMTDNLTCGKDEKLIARPLGTQKIAMINTLAANEQMFAKPMSLRAARYIIPWLDAVVYEDMRHLSSGGNFTKGRIGKALS